MNDIIIYIFAVAIFAVLVIAVPILGGSFGRKSRGKKSKYGNAVSLDKRFVSEKWKNIRETFALGGTSHMKSAIMEADKLVDHALKSRGMSGETMGERMKSAKKLFSHYADYDNLWFAHKVRNNIAHEATHDLNSGEAKRTMEYFEKALKVLGVL